MGGKGMGEGGSTAKGLAATLMALAAEPSHTVNDQWWPQPLEVAPVMARVWWRWLMTEPVTNPSILFPLLPGG